ncbi:MAG: hypothetical protein PHX83_14550 [Acidobacteriia bacterium]|nr:hypothetical protein [Terriglobia bacterium]
MQHLTTLRYFVVLAALVLVALLGCTVLVDGEVTPDELGAAGSADSTMGAAGGQGGAPGLPGAAGQGGAIVDPSAGAACTFASPSGSTTYLPPAVRRLPDGGLEC